MCIVRRCFTPTAAFIIVLTLLGKFDGSAAERWSRQISNSEWIPLANPGTASAQLPRGNAEGGLLSSSSATHLPNPVQSLSLPPALQQQYQEQLIQLQKTQESIQKLLLLQQQLKTQQQLLQTQTFIPGDYSNAEDEKQALPPSSLGNLQTTSELASEALVPSHPSSGALPPVHPPQNFLPQRPGQASYQNSNQKLSNLPIQGQGVILQHGGNVEEELHAYVTKQGNQRPDGKRLKGQPALPQSSLIENVGDDEEEEVQLVYVPAETLAQRGQPKRVRGRKQYPVRQHHQQRENQGNFDQTSLSPDQETYARQILQQIQQEHEEKAQFLKEERIKEFTRLNEEQKALERKARLQQEALQREQELLRQKEAERKRKELERLEEMARQRELDRIREAREKQRQEELERRRLSELRIKEERRREEEARQREESQKLARLEQQRILESQQEDQLRPTNPSLLHQNVQSQALNREQQERHQHLTEGTRIKKIRGRQRPRVNQYQEQSNYRETTTTPSPNQPPLSVYMGGPTSRLDNVKVTDVLRLLKHAKTIAVLDNVGPDSPQVFVGPSNLDPPYGYAKFDLPYLSSIDHNRVERKVDKLPFFVAPLSFDPPPGYSKIPFPAPHIGSVVVNTLSESNTSTDEQNPNPTPLIEPNSYGDADQGGSIATTASYDSSTTQNFSPESSSPKYEHSYSTPSSNSKFRFKQYYDSKPTSGASITTYYDEQSAKTKPKQYYGQESKSTTQPPKFDTTVSYRQEVSYSSTPNFQDKSINSQDPSTKEQDLAAQLALINQELSQQREIQKYNTAEQYHSQTNLGDSYDANDVRAPVGPTQYNLPAELPPISPHLPGLVNSLLDKQERNPPVAPTPPPTTTTTTTPTPRTTTAHISSTTYRPRGRSRIVPTRPKTTQAPGSKTRRPIYNRSKSRFTTTTEEYRDSSYEPTKEAKTPETTQKYNAAEHRRPVSRTQKYRNRDRASSHPQSTVQSHNVPAANFENYPQTDSQSNVSPDMYTSVSGPGSSLHQKEIPPSGMSNYAESYPTLLTPTQTENYPPLREVTAQHSTPLMSDDYSRSQNYPQNHPQETRYQQQDAAYDQNSDFQHSGLEGTPVNGFNYQVANENLPDQTIPQKSKEYPRYQEDANYNLAATEDTRQVTPGEERRYSPIYEVNVAQTQPDYNAGGQNPFRNVDDGKIESAAIETDPNASPSFVPLQQSKQQDYELQIPSTEPSLIEIATTSTTTPAPVIIRQRVRARLGGRTHHDSAIQTRPRGSQDEYVRFSVVNNDSGRGTGHRHRERTRTRTRPQSHGSQVQTEGNEYIKIQAAQQQKLIATTTPPTTTTTTTTTTPRTAEEDFDYGFIRPPSFRPVHPLHPSVDNRFQAPITYRPALSEIQHILPSDETAVESSPSHILKNRPKYQTSNRRPSTTKVFATTTTSTTTEVVPVATIMPDDDAAFTVKPKTRPEESKSTRVRGRVRRPGKKRVTTTTESGLEANNELPLDENYPRITPQQLPVMAAGQQPVYDDNFDVTPQFVPSQNRPAQLYEENSESYPPQEFVLNFGNLPEQVSQGRVEYDQTQLASISSKKYSHSSNANSDANAHSGDIYGSESQWSTKLSKTSFQPSFASNRVAGESKGGRGRTGDDRENENAPEIITAGPDVSSVTVVVSSDYQKQQNDADNMGVMDGFGWKTNVQESHTEKLNATTAVTPATVLQDQVQNDKETLLRSRDWTSTSTEQTDDVTKVTKNIANPPAGRKTRRRKVRVRVRPLVDDFVTAESQHYSSAVNNLVQDQYKYKPIRESRFTTAEPIATTVTASTTTAAEATRKSILQDFLEEMLKNDEVSIPTRVTSFTTELSDWTISTPMTTPYILSNDDEATTLKENNTPIDSTLTSNNGEKRIATISEQSNGSKDESRETTSTEGITRLSQEEIQVQEKVTSEEYSNGHSQEDKSEQNNLENVQMFSQRYKLPLDYSSQSRITGKDKDSTAGSTDLAKEETRKPSAIGKVKEHIMTLKKQENVEGNEAHPKNHRAKWSEVRYPSGLDKSQTASNPYSTTPIPGIVTRKEGDGSVKTLSDYVKAIFDTMKNSEEDEEEIAMVTGARNETLTDNSRSNDATSVYVARENEELVTTDYPQDTSATQRTEIEESATKSVRTQGATTKGSATLTFETTTLIPDTTANTVVPSEEVPITESPSATTTKTATSIRQMGNVFRTNSTMLGKVLRTSTTTKVSHMTEICYRGRCVMTKPKVEEGMTR
ncbi:hypothetical protein P5V15_006094 [Pogonomyrmex californicus]